MRDIATATLSGNLTRDIELRALPSGADVARLRVASTARRRVGEEWVDKTNYFTVEVFGAQARVRAGRYFQVDASAPRNFMSAACSSGSVAAARRAASSAKTPSGRRLRHLRNPLPRSSLSGPSSETSGRSARSAGPLYRP